MNYADYIDKVGWLDRSVIEASLCSLFQTHKEAQVTIKKTQTERGFVYTVDYQHNKPGTPAT